MGAAIQVAGHWILKPVAKVNPAIAAKCAGSLVINRAASTWVSQRILTLASLNLRIGVV